VRLPKSAKLRQSSLKCITIAQQEDLTMIRITISSILLISLIACNHKLLAQSLIHSPRDAAMTMTKTGINIHQVNLIAWEEKSLPLGSKPDPQREIGFASVVIALENRSQHLVPVTIQQVQVRNLFGVQLTATQPITLALRPLERVDYPIRLTNKTGFSGFGQVRAIATLNINGETQVVESDAIAVQRH
jgi:hypothetical protein